MAQQLIYTSAARLLDAGRSGFGTVARSKTISPLLVSAIERVSQFSNIRGTERSRVIFVHRRMVAGSNRFHILSRIADAGADYTGRTNHIAHHLIVTQEEMARAASVGITPADVLTQFPWLSRWEGNARFLTPEEDVNLATFQPLGRQSARSGWADMTGNPSHARLLAWDGAPRNGILLMPVHADPLALLAEGLAEFGSQSWSKAFTTALETTDELSELDWIIATPVTYPEIQRRCGNRATLDLTNPESLRVPPEPVPEPRKTPLSDLTPSTESHTAANAPKPAIQPVQTGAGQVRVGGNAGKNHSQTTQKPTARPKQNVPIIVAAAVAVIALVFLGVAALSSREHKTKGDEITADAPALSGNQEKALSYLKQAGIAEEDAKKIVIGANDDSSAWVGYIKGIIQTVKNSDPTMNPSWPIIRAPKEPDGSPVWLSSLVAAGKQWVDVLEKPAPPTDFTGKLNGIDNISKALTEYLVATPTATGEMQLTKNDINTFEQTQIRREFRKLLGEEQTPLSQESKDQLFTAIRSGNLSYQKFPKRYDIFVEVIRERFVTIKSLELLDVLKGSAANPKIDDLTGLEQAFNFWDKPEIVAGEKIKNSGFVPHDYKELREAHHKSSRDSLTKINGGEEPKKKDVTGTPEPMTQPGVDLDGVKQKQIIIVSAEDLTKGVEVQLLSKLLQSYNQKELIINGLRIEIDGNKKNPEDYKYKVKDQNYYSYAVIPTPVKKDGLKIFEDGRIVLPGIEKNAIICFKSNESEFNAYILVDRKINDPFIPTTKFSFKKIDENRVEIVGSVREWLEAIEEKDQRQIVYVLDDKNIVFTLNMKNFSLDRPSQKLPAIVFSETASNQIKQCHAIWKEISNEKSNKKSEITENQKKFNEALVNLKLSIQRAIGEALIVRDLKKNNKGEITIADDQNLVKIIKNNYNITLATRKLSENEKDEMVKENRFQEDLNKMIHKVGEAKFDETLKSLVGANWDKELPKNAVSTKIDKYINEIIKSAKRPEVKPSFDEALKIVSEITIQTRRGRVLFKATKQP